MGVSDCDLWEPQYFCLSEEAKPRPGSLSKHEQEKPLLIAKCFM